MELYIHKDLVERFQKEKDRNSFINQLLRDHYEKSTLLKTEESQRQTNDRKSREEISKPQTKKTTKDRTEEFRPNFKQKDMKKYYA